MPISFDRPLEIGHNLYLRFSEFEILVILLSRSEKWNVGADRLLFFTEHHVTEYRAVYEAGHRRQDHSRVQRRSDIVIGECPHFIIVSFFRLHFRTAVEKFVGIPAHFPFLRYIVHRPQID